MDSKLKEIDNMLHNLAYVDLEYELDSETYKVIIHRIEEIRNLLGELKISNCSNCHCKPDINKAYEEYYNNQNRKNYDKW